MHSALIVAAGRGTRMGPGIDKLFLEVAGQPVIAHTWRAFDRSPCIDEVVLVIREDLRVAFTDLAGVLQLTKPFRLVAGGLERQDSVANGLSAVDERCQLVAIQDGARPCTSSVVIAETLAAARKMGAAVAAQAVTDTIKESDDGQTIARHLDRRRLWAVQTPQIFRIEVIRRALALVREKGLVVTDDTAACEFIGQSVELVVSAEPNPKVTVPADLAYVELLLRDRH